MATNYEIPENAVEDIEYNEENGQKEFAWYRVDGEIVGRRFWNEAGLLIMEQTLKNNRWHGPQRQWHDNGRLQHETFFTEGKEDGVSRQYDEEGQLVGTCTFDDGTGLAIWYEKPDVRASERQMVRGAPHGWSRIYHTAPDGAAPVLWGEEHFWRGELHGIRRRWNPEGRLSRGFPQYFVGGEKVTKPHYVTASKRDPDLPPFRKEDNDPRREPMTL